MGLSAVLIALLGAVAAIAVSVLSKLCADEAKAWLPKITDQLISKAVDKLPEDYRDRYREEWTAYIAETPGDMTKAARAFGLKAAAKSINIMVWEGAPLTMGGRAGDATKRCLDIGIAILALVVLLPMIVVIIIAVKLESPGPIFFSRMRTGQYGKLIKVWAFRTMTAEPFFSSGTKPENSWARASDSQVTRVGRFLRNTGIDELPSLLNVLTGSMSVVGPRPHHPTHASLFKDHIPNYSDRFRVKPGLTGYAQINEIDSEIRNAERRARLDEHYVANRGFWLDIRIILVALVRWLGGRSH